MLGEIFEGIVYVVYWAFLVIGMFILLPATIISLILALMGYTGPIEHLLSYGNLLGI